MKARHSKLAGAFMIGGAALANVGFLLLGSRFDYPDILQRPAAEVLGRFEADAAAIAALFLLLALGAALLIPIAWLTRQLVPAERPALRRFALAAGVGAGIVQVIGLMRWPTLVPHLADVVTNASTSAAARADAISTFQTLHDVLGGLIGETFGYALTAAWTIAMVVGVAGERRPGRWFAPAGAAAAVLIATGLLIPLDVPGTDMANFVGYILWSVWMVGFGVSLLRGGATSDAVVRRPLATPATSS
jgi:hypothetical protein